MRRMMHAVSAPGKKRQRARPLRGTAGGRMPPARLCRVDTCARSDLNRASHAACHGDSRALSWRCGRRHSSWPGFALRFSLGGTLVRDGFHALPEGRRRGSARARAGARNGAARGASPRPRPDGRQAVPRQERPRRLHRAGGRGPASACSTPGRECERRMTTAAEGLAPPGAPQTLRNASIASVEREAALARRACRRVPPRCSRATRRTPVVGELGGASEAGWRAGIAGCGPCRG